MDKPGTDYMERTVFKYIYYYLKTCWPVIDGIGEANLISCSTPHKFAVKRRLTSV